MKRSGLPDGAVANAMLRDGVTPPPGFFGEGFEAPKAAAPLPKPVPHAAPAAAAEHPRTGGGGGDLVSALQGFDRTHLRRAEDAPPRRESNVSSGGGGGDAGGLVSQLAQFDRSKLRRASNLSTDEKKVVAKAGQEGFAGAFADAIDQRRKFIHESDDENDEEQEFDWN